MVGSSRRRPQRLLSAVQPGRRCVTTRLDIDGWHFDRTRRAGEFALYDEYDPRRKIMLNATARRTPTRRGLEWFLNFATTKAYVPAGVRVPKPTARTSATPEASNDGDDRIFGDTGNDWLVGGTGRDDALRRLRQRPAERRR
jgi:hypothetical protein